MENQNGYFASEAGRAEMPMRGEDLVRKICELIDDFYLTVKGDFGRLGHEKEKLKHKIEELVLREEEGGG